MSKLRGRTGTKADQAGGEAGEVSSVGEAGGEVAAAKRAMSRIAAIDAPAVAGSGPAASTRNYKWVTRET